ncbi:plasmid mobilization relaxosome protein MobC [Clostridium sp. VAP23]|uniref:plasmid mobilization protein n=1 Tax=Clostridium sp. VAP23 TaxID=2949981 RepID=UPI00207AAAF6|nr:plasmid mobilization relaxosome protein MobC [Clostridium sp. VAP23]
MEVKYCVSCKKDKGINEFSKNQKICKKCSKEYREKNKDNINEKSKTIGIRFNMDELKVIEDKANLLNLKPSPFLKEIILNNMTKVILKVDFSSLDNLAYEINKIGVNINQIARIANSDKHIYKSDIEYLREKQERIEEMLCNYYDIVLRLQKKMR